MATKKKLDVLSMKVSVELNKTDDFISLTDIAKYRNPDDPRFIIQNWMRTRFTIDFMGIWEQLHNPNFNRVEFEAVKNEAGRNAFVMTPTKWVELTGAIGVIAKSGRYGGTYAHKDIAFEFAIFQNHGYKDLGLVAKGIQQRKGVMHMLENGGSAEWGFSMQIEKRMLWEELEGKNKAYVEVGGKVRQKIEEMAGEGLEGMSGEEMVVMFREVGV